jgi:hypothetical protein
MRDLRALKMALAVSLVSCLVAATPLVFGQGKKHIATSQPFGLKGDTLGETIAEFRSRNERTVQTPPNAKQSKAIHLPLCADDLAEGRVLSHADIDDLLHTDEEIQAGIVECRATLNRHENMDLFINNGFDLVESFKYFDEPTVAGAGAYQTVYYFFSGKLYKIQSELPAEDYAAIRGTFVEKYGKPSVTMHRYQNGFGAQVDGEELLWDNGNSQIRIGQLDGTNTLDGSANQVQVVFWHKVIGKLFEEAGASKDRAKDL